MTNYQNIDNNTIYKIISYHTDAIPDFIEIMIAPLCACCNKITLGDETIICKCMRTVYHTKCAKKLLKLRNNITGNILCIHCNDVVVLQNKSCVII